MDLLFQVLLQTRNLEILGHNDYQDSLWKKKSDVDLVANFHQPMLMKQIASITSSKDGSS